MAPSAPKDRYYQADFFAQLFQNKSIFWVPANALPAAILSYFRDPFWDPSANMPTLGNEAGCTRQALFAPSARTHIRQTDIKQTRTSYLGTGVAD